MSESILKALMQLFAIIAHVDETGVSDSARKIVKAYLQNHLNQAHVAEYLALFDAYIDVHHRDIKKKDGTKIRKRTSANSVKVLMICRQINEELEQKQKVLVLLQVLEFIVENVTITEKELDFVRTVADIFNISESEYNSMKALIIDGAEHIAEKANTLIISAEKTATKTEAKHIKNSGLLGEIVVLNIRSTGMYAFRYFGNQELYLNGHLVIPNRIFVLDQGATIRGPKIKAIYYSDIVGCFMQERTTHKIRFTAQNVEFRFAGSDNGIHNFNFSEESGQLIGIMGGSGVGKSTLLSVLNGNLRPNSGSITINGYDVYDDKNKLHGVIGFVPQDDLLIEDLSVFQNLYYNAKLCFKDLSEQKISNKIVRILHDLDLFEIRSLKVGDPLNKFISGGQRKRLNIALELMREPSVMFVDEPTSGLSSMDSDMVMDLLKEQSLKGKLLIVNIHQPSSDIYKLFDKLLILDKGGHVIYNGNPIDAVVYFKRMSLHANADESECMRCGNVKPEQVLQIVEAKVVNEFGRLTRNRKVSPKEWYERYKENVEAKLKIPEVTQTQLPANDFHIPSKLKQLKIFSTRNVLSKLADRQYMLINFLEAPLLAFILGYFTKFISDSKGVDVYKFNLNENLPAYLFMAVVVALFMGLTVSAEEIIKDRKILKRESFLNLSRWSYLNSKILILFLISAIQVMSFIIVGNWILDVKGLNMSYFLILFSASATANLIGLNISSAMKSVITIYILIPFILVPQLLLSGVIVKFDKLHKSIASHYYVPVVGDLMTSRWAYEALAIKQFKNNEYNRYFFDIEQKVSSAGFTENFIIKRLDELTLQAQNLIGDTAQTTDLQYKLKILSNELPKLGKMDANGFYGNLSESKFDKKTANETSKFLRAKRKEYTALNNNLSKERDKIYNAVIKKLGSREALIQLDEEYNNQGVADIVTNKNELNRLYERRGMLIQKADPIYMYPNTTTGRAHFYAPVKIVGKYVIDTFWFNIGAMWLMTTVLYFTLWHDTLRKLINIGTRRKLPRIIAKLLGK